MLQNLAFAINFRLGLEGLPGPALFTAQTLNSYSSPSFNPFTVPSQFGPTLAHSFQSRPWRVFCSII